MLPNFLTLEPIGTISGTVRLPGSKSLSNRILLLSALAHGETEVTNILDSDDVEVMLTALKQLGVTVVRRPESASLRVIGRGGGFDGLDAVGETKLHVGNAGTVIRPLAAVLTAGHGRFVLEGSRRMHERPIKDLVDALRKLGARVDYLDRDGYPPLRIVAMGLHAGDLGVSGAISSQYLSSLLMTAPLADGAVTLRVVDHLVSAPYVDMTIAIMARFGVRVERQGELAFHIPDGQRYRSPGRMLVEGDASSASYFLAGAAITGGTVRVEGCGSDSLQGDARFADVLEKMGARVKWEPGAIEVTGPGPAAGRLLRGIEVNLEAMPDAAMTLAVAALFAQGPTTLKGIGNWRVKETDRMAAVSRELKKLGAETEVGKDHLTVHPPDRIATATVATYNDHRMAMSFSLAACGPSPIVIEDPSCVSKTFPTYFDELAALIHRAKGSPPAAAPEGA